MEAFEQPMAGLLAGAMKVWVVTVRLGGEFEQGPGLFPGAMANQLPDRAT